MNRNSDRAGTFIAVATFEKAWTSGEHTEGMKEAVYLKPETTIAELFAKIWPTDDFSRAVFKPPFRIELMPDKTSIPEEERDPFFSQQE